MPVESSNRSLRPLLRAAGVGDGANVLGTEDGMKFCPTWGRESQHLIDDI
jgi:hypothetical protein